MRIIAISDTHGFHEDIRLPPHEEGDVLVHAGDITRRGELSILNSFSEWLSKTPYEKIIIIAGNHDFCFEKEEHNISKDILENNSRHPGKIIYLQNESVVVDGIKFYGSPYQPRFNNWAFNVDRGRDIKKEWDKIPLDTDILITHGPAKEWVGGMLREVVMGRQSVQDLGCEELIKKIKEVNPIYHICGHIHDGYGIYRHDECDTVFCNASICTEAYEPTNGPFILPVNKENNNKQQKTKAMNESTEKTGKTLEKEHKKYNRK